MKRAILSSKIFTGISSAPWAEALLTEGGSIALVGDNETIRAAMDADTEVMELPGRLITPGFVDAHCHLGLFGLSLKQVSFAGVTSLARCRELIRQAAENLKPGEWLTGGGWNQHFWEESRMPDRHDLDDLVPDNPVVLTRACTHLIWVNSKALEVAGIDENTPEPAGGRIDRDPGTGLPTGIIRESVELVLAHAPQLTREGKKEALCNAQELYLSHGITGVHNCESLDDYLALAELEREGRLKLRVCHLLPPGKIKDADRLGISPGKGSDRLWHTHVKMFLDGSLGAETAWLHIPYENTSDRSGIACMTSRELLSNIMGAYQTGRSVAVHAIGDRAVTEALDAIEEARKGYPGPWRDRIEHVQLCRPQDVKRFRELDITASVQPIFLPTDWKTAEEKWGKERCRYAYAWKSLAEAGVKLQFGSDAPIEPINPLPGVQAALTRRDLNGEPKGGWYMDQALTLEECLAGYTRYASWTAGKERFSGTIEAGKWADLTVFSEDLTALPHHQVHRASVEMTLINGEVAWRRMGKAKRAHHFPDFL